MLALVPQARWVTPDASVEPRDLKATHLIVAQAHYPRARRALPTRTRRHASRARMTIIALLVTALATSVASCASAAPPNGGPSPSSSTNPSSGSFEAFAPGTPFRTRIPANAVVDSRSETLVARLSRDEGLYSNLVEFGIPVYHANQSTPRFDVQCTKDWGQCPFEGYQVPIPENATPSPGSDGAMVVLDEETREIFEFWQAAESDGQWSTSWAAVGSLDGDGWEDHGYSTGSGASRLGGVIMISEIQAGEIPHALALQSDNVCADIFRAPATRTDGLSTRPDCVPAGSRLRLDPSIDLGSLALPPATHMVAQALQDYGGYIMDVSSAPLSVSFELDTAAADDSIGEVYREAGLRWDYDHLPGVPWDRLQVLAE